MKQIHASVLGSRPRQPPALPPSNALSLPRTIFFQEQSFMTPVLRRPKLMEVTMVTESRETGNLIGSDKVEGTAVYGADRTKIGSIERVMIDKQSGRVSYAVLS